jgi:hypothetical protein
MLSQSEGYFGYLGSTSGTYTARTDTVQLRKLAIKTASQNTDFITDKGTYGAFIADIEFVLHKNH